MSPRIPKRPTRCPDCTWVEVTKFGDRIPKYVISYPCEAHLTDEIKARAEAEAEIAEIERYGAPLLIKDSEK